MAELPPAAVPPPADLSSDPVRRLVQARAFELGYDMKRLSLALGLNPAYFHQYLKKGKPRVLPETVREPLARLLNVREADLRPPRTERTDRLGGGPANRPPAPPAQVPHGPAPDLPVFRDTDELDQQEAAQWIRLLLPGPTASPVGFGLWITADRGRLRPGDLAFVSRQPPRVGDLVVVVADRRVAGIGELRAIDTGAAMVDEGGGEPRRFDRTGHEILKVIGAIFA